VRFRHSDDTSVCLLHVEPQLKDDRLNTTRAKVLFHRTITSDNRIFGGIHPIISLRSHRVNLATLLKSCTHELRLKYGPDSKPDLVAVTRGPGIAGCLDVGLETAKGLAVAWDVPLVGVHHMQAHALTMRLSNALQTTAKNDGNKHTPDFPFLSLLVSGGHTLLVLSTSLTKHRILVDTLNIAIGDAMDKSARSILPKDITSSSEKYVKDKSDATSKIRDSTKHTPSNPSNNTVAYGKLLESFVFPKSSPTIYAKEFESVPGGPSGRSNSDCRIILPLTGKNSATHGKLMNFSFSSFPTNVDNVLERHWKEVLPQDDVANRRRLGLEVMTRMFQHLLDRIRLALTLLDEEGIKVNDIVVGGGVASNKYLRYL